MVKIGIIGLGNMGSAMAGIMKKSGYAVFHYDPAIKHSPYSICCSSISQLLKRTSVLVIAVKPQNFPAVKPELDKNVMPAHTIISIMAGVSLHAISRGIKYRNVIRSMPNLALSTQTSLTGWYSLPGCSTKSVTAARKIFSVWGKQVKCRREADLNVITAAAGSGPAYFLMIADLVQRFCEARGFSKKESLLISWQVLEGTQRFIASFPLPPLEIIKKISSRGGTTEAAFNHMKSLQIEKKILRAMAKAEQRAKQLSEINEKLTK